MRIVDRAGLSVGSMLALLVIGCAKQDPAAPAPSAPHATSATSSAIPTKSGVAMVLIPAGEFVLGDNHGEDDEQPAQRVEVSAFYMDVHEVTQQSFQAILGRNPAKSIGPDKPVERVSWFAAIQYCNMRSLRDGFQPCYDLRTQACDFAADGYRLPTEAEWEYACRAATTTRWSFGDQAGELGKHAWYKANSGKITHPVGEKPPNPWGLYDLHGNVAEWCHDFYADRYDAGTSVKDPRGPTSGTERVLRGGSWKSSEDSCRCSARHSEAPGFADVCFGYEAYGFRCVRRVPGDGSAL
ncbi:MAG: formylglycine-generating enzyme family protein [Planctomycetota bacterium]|nr:formylglycine-generating enzyme family protein [Planctomycetota bacterium]